MIRSPSRLVNALGYLALTLLLALPLAVLIVRVGAWQQGLALYAIASLGAAVVLLLAIVLFFIPRYRHQRKDIALRALLVVPGTLLLLGLLSTRGDYPPIHDISTNLSDPPVFVNAPDLRGPNSNSLEIKPESLAAQREAYPDLQSIRTPLTPNNAYQRALDVATELGWEVVYQDPENWHIEAVDTTAIMAFKDDIVIRVRSTADGSVVDLRSVSRVGVSDLGANAQRLRDFSSAFVD
ncbi:DUF1499 domain-containing protein [Kineobactrum sediminis]|uniref:DUF1499 domain-containing protein n=1 Tax=Kineobactrum sediminis TaxID=1905677 RepID=A0A2N5Y0M8_9GAMM|nr:DUF1499 domain-containing protein [Kineobactrum sediminis]PLW81950.1 DUF1499 domain-containing protein [Kineobactrum sediminis]